MGLRPRAFQDAKCSLPDEQNTQLLQNGGFHPFVLIPQGLGSFWHTVGPAPESHHLFQEGKRASGALGFKRGFEIILWWSGITVHDAGTYIPAVRPLLKCQWGKKKQKNLCFLLLRQGWATGPARFTGSASVEYWEGDFLGNQVKLLCCFPSLLYWVGSGHCAQQRRLMSKEVRLRILWLMFQC